MAARAYEMSAAARRQRRAASEAAAAKNPREDWYSVRLRASDIALIDAARGDLSRAEHVRRKLSR